MICKCVLVIHAHEWCAFYVRQKDTKCAHLVLSELLMGKLGFTPLGAARQEVAMGVLGALDRRDGAEAGATSMDNRASRACFASSVLHDEVEP